jgi:hypothetical protein
MRFIDRSSGAPAVVELLGSPAAALVIATGGELRLINGVAVIAKFDGEHNAMPTPVAAQATFDDTNRAVTGEGIRHAWMARRTWQSVSPQPMYTLVRRAWEFWSDDVATQLHACRQVWRRQRGSVLSCASMA